MEEKEILIKVLDAKIKTHKRLIKKNEKRLQNSVGFDKIFAKNEIKDNETSIEKYVEDKRTIENGGEIFFEPLDITFDESSYLSDINRAFDDYDDLQKYYSYRDSHKK